MIVTAIWFLTILDFALASLVGIVIAIVQRHVNHVLLFGAIGFLVTGGAEFALLLKLHASVASYAAVWKKTSQPSPGKLLYVAMGDSAAQGIGASSLNKAYVSIIADYVKAQTGRPVEIINISVSGGRLKDVIDVQLPQLAHLKPDLVTLDIGANDITRGTPQNVMIADYQSLIEAVNKYPVVVANIPDFMWGTQQRNTMLINESILVFCQQNFVQFADLHDQTYAKMWSWNEFAADGFHPSNAGHRTWANAFMPGVKTIIENRHVAI